MRRRVWIAWILYGLAALVLAGITHIVAVLDLPYRVSDDSFTRITAVAPVNTMAVLKPPGIANDGIPFRDPAMAMAVCRYDLSPGPLRISIEPFDQAFLSVAIHGRHGESLYGLTTRANERSTITMVMMTPSQAQEAEARDSGEEPTHDLRLTSPETQGFVTLETPAGDSGDLSQAEDNFSHVRCGTVTPQAQQP